MQWQIMIIYYPDAMADHDTALDPDRAPDHDVSQDNLMHYDKPKPMSWHLTAMNQFQLHC